MSKAALMYTVSECISQCKWSWYKMKKPLLDSETFDRASRGIWGSASLLPRTNWRHASTLGTLITILGIINSPITQQAVPYDLREVVTNHDAYTSACVHLESLDNVIETEAVLLQSAVFQAMDYYRRSSDFLRTCETTPCTYPAIRSLGICSRVTELDSLEFVLEYNPTANASDWTAWEDFQINGPFNESYIGAWNMAFPTFRNKYFVSPTPYTVEAWQLNDSLVFKDDPIYPRIHTDSLVMYMKPRTLSDSPTGFANIMDSNVDYFVGRAYEIAPSDPLFELIFPYESRGTGCQAATFVTYPGSWFVFEDGPDANLSTNADTLRIFKYVLALESLGSWLFDGIINSVLSTTAHGVFGQLFAGLLRNDGLRTDVEVMDHVFGEVVLEMTNTMRTFPKFGNETDNSVNITGITRVTETYVRVG
ncbi:hypothetical protein GQ53DRAFT_825535 [Thozetella sp. PMI_491]|nr:hypothetical protein GQ53DRAFT_825535 [Thozetella sp. PMI_491]